MSAQESSTPTMSTDKGKGKEIAAEHTPGHDDAMDDDDDEEESGAEDHGEPEEADEDNMEEIDQSNIVGDRTRGKQIDWNEADRKAREAGDEMDDDDDEDDDEDFVAEDDDEMEG